jgi:hypothetical protein
VSFFPVKVNENLISPATFTMHKSCSIDGASRRGIKKNYVKNQTQEQNVSLVNCDNKTNHCNRYSSDALLSGQNRSGKLSIDDESSCSINGSNTNKSERKRNINMLMDEDKNKVDVYEGDCDVKRIKFDGNVDNNKSKMYQVSIVRREFYFV